VGRRARQLGDRLRAPTAGGLQELLRELLDLQAGGTLKGREELLLTSTIEVARCFKAALDGLERALDARLQPPQAPAGGWAPVLRRAGIEQVLQDPGGAAHVRGLLTELLPRLKGEFTRVAFDRGMLDRKDDTAAFERAMEAFQSHAMGSGQEVAGLDALLSGYHLILSVRLARLAAALEGKG
jgi:hypothetical protein